jgi:hypothetical protein
MAHLWVRNSEGAWAVEPIEPPLSRLDDAIAGAPPDGAARRSLSIASAPAGSATVWVLVAGLDREVRVNGLRLLAGLRVLADRDHVAVAGGRSFFFSTEFLARVQAFTPLDREIQCPRCQQSLEARAPAVRCPQCGVWHHQQPELECWTYAARCSLCDQRTALDTGYRWSPEALW